MSRNSSRLRRFYKFGLAAFTAGSLLSGLAVSDVARGDGISTEPSVDFARQILPILSNKCFICHGPDTRDEDMLRLDSFELASADRGGYKAIDAGSPGESEILARIHSEDAPMPPAEAEKQLTEEERELLSRWVREGGAFAVHWAFIPPRKVLPAGSAGLSGSEVVDAFVASRLSKRGVTFAPEADRATLARRVALVLTGLPPEPHQLERFLGDSSPGSYEQFVEELLSSPRFGEHQARYWLDAVRYGDTHGLHLDNRRGIYPYRDWVVHALNENLPLDTFITWQLAGDLLPQPTLGQRVATGFVRLNPTTSEGGAIPAEFQCKNNFDRVETLGTALLGMSLTCARCHTHKYDPIPQTEYYQLMAFFNSTAESAMDGNAYEYGPVVRAPANQAQWRIYNRLETDCRQLLADPRIVSAASPDAVTPYASRTAKWQASDWQISEALAVTAAGEGGLPAESEFTAIEGLPGTTDVKLPGDGRVRWVRFIVEGAVDQTLWLKFSGGPASQVFIDGVAAGNGRSPAPQAGQVHDPNAGYPLSLTHGRHEVLLKLEGTTASPIAVGLENTWRQLAEGKSWFEMDRDDRLRTLADVYGPLADLDLQQPATALLSALREVQQQFTTTLVAADLPHPRETHVLSRGEYNLPIGDPLEPDVLAVMAPMPEGAPRNRLGLARWLTSRQHPLVSRVLINRIWQRTFGEGLVRTPEDFGVQGQYPTHPQLLDWLAVDLQDSGWDLKHMLRTLVTSRTFRQHSARRPDIDDPENRLLARGPRFRLDAEVIRDVALWSSALLDPHMGGEGVKPYQPPGMWKALAHPGSNTKQYVRDKGQRLYRRSLYVYWKRTSPHPMMTLFDAPDRESSCVRRSRSNTSLQSLGLFNETQRMEMSRKFAERLLHEGSDDELRLDLAFSLLACRAATHHERAACMNLLNAMRKRYDSDPAAATAVLTIGDVPRDESLELAEHAAWTQLAVTLLASDLALMLY